MPRNIVLLSDGTGNSASKVWRTNVWRMFEAIDLTGTSQVAFYDDGVGTSSFKPLALLGGAFGWGLKRNVLDLYKFACRNYKDPTDEIFAFGFSRGAFTIRVVIGLILHQGLVPFQTEGELESKARAAYRAYRRDRYHSIFRIEDLFRAIRDFFVGRDYDPAKNIHVQRIRFLGLWDTVAAYGLPIDEMTLGFSRWIWPLELPSRTLHPKIERAAHALALDDERTTFHPVLWNETGEKPVYASDGRRFTKDQRISQVWFAGVHCNVGGGYPDDSLAHVPLCWMMDQAQACNLRLKQSPAAYIAAVSVRDKDGRKYDSRSGLGGYYRYGPRKLIDLCHMRVPGRPDDTVEIALPKIHESALKRTKEDVHHYAPIVLPAEYEVVTDAGEILLAKQSPYETSQEAANRSARQEAVWDVVWMRRVVYFLTVGTSLYLVAYPLSRKIDDALVYSTSIRPISDLIGLFGGFLPSIFSVWIDAYQASPGRFLTVVGVLTGLLMCSAWLNARIGDRMRTIWRTPSSAGTTYRSLLYRLRTSKPYRDALKSLKYRLAPGFFALLFVYLALTLTSHLAFTFADSAGIVCQSSPDAKLIASDASPVTKSFNTKGLCVGTGVIADQGSKYKIEVKELSQWVSHDIPTSMRGYHLNDLGMFDRARMTLLWPLKRAFIRPFSTVIVRFGTSGNDEDFLDLSRHGPNDYHQETITARRGGEIFVYVNNAVLALPGLADAISRNNKGEAQITIHKL